MKVYMAATEKGRDLLDAVKPVLDDLESEQENLSDEGKDSIDLSDDICKKLKDDPSAVGLIIDEYGDGAYMACNKHKGIVASIASDERSALMTRRHNGARILILSSGIVGKNLAKSCVERFMTYDYDGGRHQIRIDMLNKML